MTRSPEFAQRMVHQRKSSECRVETRNRPVFSKSPEGKRKHECSCESGTMPCDLENYLVG